RPHVVSVAGASDACSSSRTTFARPVAAAAAPRAFARNRSRSVDMDIRSVTRSSDRLETPRKHTTCQAVAMPVQVHHRGDRGVDGILRLIELASHDGPIETMLTAMCEQVAAIADVAVASIYVCEDDALVMRGNHGFGESALGTTLGVGEG